MSTTVGALQVALDKGQEADWFGSHFIMALLIIAAVGLASFVIWEWFQEQPTLEDYRKLQAATRTMQVTDEGQHVTVIFPDVTSLTLFDESKGR